MAVALDKQEIIKRLATIEAWAAGLQLECQNTRKMLEEADVSTSANNNNVSKIAIEARYRLRQKIFK
jgi:hypothetical protein